MAKTLICRIIPNTESEAAFGISWEARSDSPASPSARLKTFRSLPITTATVERT